MFCASFYIMFDSIKFEIARLKYVLNEQLLILFTNVQTILYHYKDYFVFKLILIALVIVSQSLPYFFSPTCPKGKFRKKNLFIQTNSSIIFTFLNPVLLVPGFGQVG